MAGIRRLSARPWVQAYAGRGPLDLGLTTSLLALVGLVLLAASGLLAVLGVAGSPRPAVLGRVDEHRCQVDDAYQLESSRPAGSL